MPVIRARRRCQRRRDPCDVIAVGAGVASSVSSDSSTSRVYVGASGQFSSMRRRLEMTLVILSC